MDRGQNLKQEAQYIALDIKQNDSKIEKLKSELKLAEEEGDNLRASYEGILFRIRGKYDPKYAPDDVQEKSELDLTGEIESIPDTQLTSEEYELITVPLWKQVAKQTVRQGNDWTNTTVIRNALNKAQEILPKDKRKTITSATILSAIQRKDDVFEFDTKDNRLVFRIHQEKASEL